MGAGQRVKYRQAALIYLLAGSLVVVLTVWGPGLRQARQMELLRLVLGLPFIILFGLLIWTAPPLLPPLSLRPRSLWSWVHRGLVSLLVVTNAGRAITFLANAMGLRLRIHSPLTTAELTLRVSAEPGAAVPHFWLNTLLMVLVVLALLRALLDLHLPLVDRSPAVGEARG